VPLDFARGHAARVQRHDLVVEAREPRLMFGQDLRLERADAVSRHFDLQFSKVPLYRLATGPVARIPAIVAHGIVLLVPQMMGQLGVQGSLHHSLDETLPQSVFADDVFRLPIILQQLVD
jgi:hypothetical protein